MEENKDRLKGIQINSKGFGTIAKFAMQDRNLDIAAKAVYAYFNSFAGGGDSCFPTRKKICYDLKISNDTLGKYLRQLTEAGYISIEQVKENGRFSHNVYTINGTILPCPKISDTENSDTEKPDTNKNSSNINNISNKNSVKKERKKEPSGYDALVNKYTNNEELKQALYEFIKMRKMIKKPLTDKALSLICTKLDKLALDDYTKIQILEQSIMNNWQGIFPLKRETNTNRPNQYQKQQPEMTEKEIEEMNDYLSLVNRFNKPGNNSEYDNFMNGLAEFVKENEE